MHIVIDITLKKLKKFLFIHSVHEHILKIFIVGFWSSLLNRKILTLTEFTSSKRELLRSKIGLFPSFSREMGIYIIDLTVNAKRIQTCKERFNQVCLSALRPNPLHSFWRTIPLQVSNECSSMSAGMNLSFNTLEIYEN